MPIYPIAQNDTRIATPNTPAPPTDPTGKQLEGLGNATTEAAIRIKDAANKRQDFIDDTMVSDRYMTAVGDMAQAAEDAQKPEVALPINGQGGAKKYMDKAITDRQPQWMKDLSPRAQRHLERKLAPKMLEYKIGAAKTENRALGDFRESQYTRMEKEFVDQFSRGNAVNEKGQVVDSDGRDTEEFKALSEYIDADVRMGYKTMTQGEQAKDAAITKAAYYRAHRLVNSESEADLIQYQKLWQKENESDGSTFLKNVDAGKRDEMNRTSHIRQVEMRDRAETQAKKKLTEESHTFASKMIRSFNSKDPADRLSDSQIEQGLDAYSTVIPPETVRSLLKMRDESYRDGGVTDWDTYHQLKIDILSGDKSISNSRIMSTGKVASKEVEELIKLNERIVAEPGVEKTPFYKEGKEHIRTLVGGIALPGMEWMMKPQDRARYSEALFTFNQHARKVFNEGDQKAIAELPSFARSLAEGLKKAKPDDSTVMQEGDNPQPQKPVKKDTSQKSKPSWAK